MKITVTFRHIDPTPALKAYAIEKTGHVEKLLIKPEQAHWILSVEKKRHIAELNCVANGVTLIGKETGEDLYAAMDEVIAKVSSQARKTKGKVKSHKPAHRRDEHTVRQPSPVRMSSLASRGARLADGGEVIRSETLHPDAMDHEEAINALEVSGKDFLVFQNKNSHHVNIVYRRDDGFFGVIEPEFGRKSGSNGRTEIPFRFEVYARDEDGKSHHARVIREREVPVKAMSIQESVQEMNKSRNHFWVFADRARQGVNVVYRTRAGEYGLIET
jgi:putative sigma-54 modulation protein